MSADTDIGMGVLDWFKEVFKREDDVEEPMKPCDRCGMEYPETSMVIDGSSIFCYDCKDKRKKEIAEMEFNRKQSLLNQKIKYHCYNCKFHFSRKKDFPLQMCPNCGSGNFVEEGRLV